LGGGDNQVSVIVLRAYREEGKFCELRLERSSRNFARTERFLAPRA
jgi:hypothetical protein